MVQPHQIVYLASQLGEGWVGEGSPKEGSKTSPRALAVALVNCFLQPRHWSWASLFMSWSTHFISQDSPTLGTQALKGTTRQASPSHLVSVSHTLLASFLIPSLPVGM